eukprot:g5643.t1
MPQTDRDALLALYNATDGANWNESINWDTNADLSQWHGVAVNDENRVVALSLGSNNLRGTIPVALGRLTALQELHLYDNKLSGSIPKELGALRELRGLLLHSNQLTGRIPPELGKLAALETLSLWNNRLCGRIPNELGALSKLQVLQLWDNMLSGGPGDDESLDSWRKRLQEQQQEKSPHRAPRTSASHLNGRGVIVYSESTPIPREDGDADRFFQDQIYSSLGLDALARGSPGALEEVQRAINAVASARVSPGAELSGTGNRRELARLVTMAADLGEMMVRHTEDNDASQKELALRPFAQSYYTAVRNGICHAYLAASVVSISRECTSKTGFMGKVGQGMKLLSSVPVVGLLAGLMDTALKVGDSSVRTSPLEEISGLAPDAVECCSLARKLGLRLTDGLPDDTISIIAEAYEGVFESSKNNGVPPEELSEEEYLYDYVVEEVGGYEPTDNGGKKLGKRHLRKLLQAVRRGCLADSKSTERKVGALLQVILPEANIRPTTTSSAAEDTLAEPRKTPQFHDAGLDPAAEQAITREKLEALKLDEEKKQAAAEAVMEDENFTETVVTIGEKDLKTAPEEAVLSRGLDNESPSPPKDVVATRDVLTTSLGPGPATYASRAHAVEFELQAGSLDERIPLGLTITQGLAFVDCGTDEAARAPFCGDAPAEEFLAMTFVHGPEGVAFPDDKPAKLRFFLGYVDDRAPTRDGANQVVITDEEIQRDVLEAYRPLSSPDGVKNWTALGAYTVVFRRLLGQREVWVETPVHHFSVTASAKKVDKGGKNQSYYYGDLGGLRWRFKGRSPAPRVRFGNTTKGNCATFTYYPIVQHTEAAREREFNGQIGVMEVMAAAGMRNYCSTVGGALRDAEEKMTTIVEAGTYEDCDLSYDVREHWQMHVRVGVLQDLTGGLQSTGKLQLLDVRKISGNTILVLREPRLSRPAQYKEIDWPCSAEKICEFYAGRNARCCPRVLLQQQQRQQRRCVAAIAHDGDTTKRRALPVHRATALLPRSDGCLSLSSSNPLHAHHAGAARVGGLGLLNTQPLRHLSTRRGPPQARSLPEKIFAGVVVAVLAAWGLVFGAITLLLLPFVGIALFLLRRNFQRGGVSRNLAAGLARRMAERGGVAAGGDFGGVGGVPGAQQDPTGGGLSALLATMLGGGLSGLELVSAMRRCVLFVRVASLTLDNGRKFDLTSDTFAGDANVEDGRTAHVFRGGQHSSKRAGAAARGVGKGKRTAGALEAGGRLRDFGSRATVSPRSLVDGPGDSAP